MLQSAAITPGTGKSQVLIELGHAAVHAGLRILYLTAAELVERLFSGPADNALGRTIGPLLRTTRHHRELGFVPVDPTSSQLLFRFVVAVAHEGRSIRLASHHPFEHWGRFLPE